jgi:hypothetical protein
MATLPFNRFVTRDAFMRNVMNHQEFTHYPYFMELIREVEQLFANIQKMERCDFTFPDSPDRTNIISHTHSFFFLAYLLYSVMPLQDEERLFIEAMRDLNHQASRLQAEEKAAIPNLPSAGTSATSAEEKTTTGSGNMKSENGRDSEVGSSNTTEPRDPHLDARLTAATLSVFEAGQRLQRSSSHVSLQSLAAQASPSKAKAKAPAVGSPGGSAIGDADEASAESKQHAKRTAEEAGFGFGI